MDNRPKNTLFFSLYDSVHCRLYNFLLILVHNQSDAEDLLQETAAIMWEQFDQFQEGTNFGAWAVSIARIKALEFLRQNKKSRMIFKETYYDLISNQAQQATENLADRIQMVKYCLEKLPEKDRKLLSMRYRKNITLKRISQITGRSSSGICQSFARIIAMLRSCMTKRLETQGELNDF